MSGRTFRIEKTPSWDDDGFFNVIVGAFMIQVSLPEDEADALVAELERRLLNRWLEQDARYDARVAESEARRRERIEAERPAREKAASERQEAVSRAPRVQAGKCSECGHLDAVEAFDEPGYECSTDGSSGRGPEGRRCDQCNRFRARCSQQSCPSCEQPLDGLDVVLAAELDLGDYVEVGTEVS